MKHKVFAPVFAGLAMLAMPAWAEDPIKLPDLPGGLDGAPAVVMTPELQKEAADKAAAVDKAIAAAKEKAAKAAEEKAAAEKAAADKAAADKAAADKAAADKAAADAAAKAAADAAAKPAEPAAAAAPAAADPAKPAPYMIEKGDNYWNLAGKFYGDKTMWPKLEAANPGYKANDLTIGAPLEVPAK